MLIQIKGQIPTKAHPTDVGWDLIASEPTIRGEFIELPVYFPNTGKLYSSIQYIEYNTEIAVTPPAGYYCVVVPRSSISNKQLILANFPIIDPDYTGQILLRYRFLPNPCDMVVFPDSGITRIYYRMPPEALFQKGEKLAQLILINYNDFQWETVTNLKATKRGSGGFGSTTEISETFPAKTP